LALNELVNFGKPSGSCSDAEHSRDDARAVSCNADLQRTPV
jgi:hypothetical protein